ncbi:MAG: QueT transporter family protein [Oscillospiraceae bacterium]|nr:QueT transporter family protein [Oscillospiraceae bacterium]MBR3962045.1 QueT transporter family protein [Oscillospiraceae bacterium]MBR6658077.1 QueT transporter family protein [Oscillospiraceae bacterium]
MNNKKSKTRFLTQSAMVAALYVIFTEISAVLGISSGVIQFRLSEMFAVLPIFTPAAIPGLFIGCLISNILAGGVIWDVVFGSLASLLGALGAWFLRKKSVYLAPVPTIAANMIIVPFVLRYAYGMEGTIPLFMLTVGIGEFVCAGILGVFLAKTLKKYKFNF